MFGSLGTALCLPGERMSDDVDDVRDTPQAVNQSVGALNALVRKQYISINSVWVYIQQNMSSWNRDHVRILSSSRILPWFITLTAS